jgi:hypothetical protein
MACVKSQKIAVQPWLIMCLVSACYSFQGCCKSNKEKPCIEHVDSKSIKRSMSKNVSFRNLVDRACVLVLLLLAQEMFS